jgi:hypothetical protein
LVKRSRSFFAQNPSPRIHVTEPPIEGYFDIQLESSASERRPFHEDPTEGDDEEENETSADNLGPSQRNLLLVVYQFPWSSNLTEEKI